MPKKRSPKNVQTFKYEIIDPETGEIAIRYAYEYDPEIHKVSVINKKSGIPTKTTKPFIRIGSDMTKLTYDEEAIFSKLTRCITWEDNFVRNEGKDYLTISELSILIEKSRNFTFKILKQLEEKEVIKLLTYKTQKVIYLYSRYVWMGSESNRSDKKLDEFLVVSDALTPKG